MRRLIKKANLFQEGQNIEYRLQSYKIPNGYAIMANFVTPYIPINGQLVNTNSDAVALSAKLVMKAYEKSIVVSCDYLEILNPFIDTNIWSLFESRLLRIIQKLQSNKLVKVYLSDNFFNNTEVSKYFEHKIMNLEEMQEAFELDDDEFDEEEERIRNNHLEDFKNQTSIDPSTIDVNVEESIDDSKLQNILNTLKSKLNLEQVNPDVLIQDSMKYALSEALSNFNLKAEDFSADQLEMIYEAMSNGVVHVDKVKFMMNPKLSIRKLSSIIAVLYRDFTKQQVSELISKLDNKNDDLFGMTTYYVRRLHENKKPYDVDKIVEIIDDNIVGQYILRKAIDNDISLDVVYDTFKKSKDFYNDMEDLIAEKSTSESLLKNTLNEAYKNVQLNTEQEIKTLKDERESNNARLEKIRKEVDKYLNPINKEKLIELSAEREKLENRNKEIETKLKELGFGKTSSQKRRLKKRNK